MRRAGGVGVPRRGSRRPLRRLATGVLWLKAWAAKATDDQLAVYIANPKQPSALPLNWYAPVTVNDELSECVALVQAEVRRRQERRDHSRWRTTTWVAGAALGISAVQLALGIVRIFFGCI